MQPLTAPETTRNHQAYGAPPPALLEDRPHLVEGLLHDMKNPLGVADAYLSLIEDGVIDPASAGGAEAIARARQSIRSALGILEDVVAFSEVGELQIHLCRVDLGAIVDEVVETYAAPARMKGLSLATRMLVRRPRVHTDPARVRQILANLISNAIKFTDGGGVEIVVDSEPIPGRRRAIVIRVVDSGCGIPPAKIGLLFREFSRLGSKKIGTGLGLAISRHVADALAAGLSVESTPGVGSTFTLSFPLRRRTRGIAQ